MAPTKNLGAAQRVKMAERRALALELRKQGGSYREIAAQLRALAAADPDSAPGVTEGYSEGLAYKDVMDALRLLNQRCAEEADELRRLELVRLDALWGALWPRVVDRGDMFAFDRLMTLMDRRARYLNLWPEAAPATVVENNISIGAPDFEAALAKAYGDKGSEGGGGGTEPDSAQSP